MSHCSMNLKADIVVVFAEVVVFKTICWFGVSRDTPISWLMQSNLYTIYIYIFTYLYINDSIKLLTKKRDLLNELIATIKCNRC